MTRHFATVAHARQVPVLLASMRRHCVDFMLHTLAWDWSPGDRPGDPIGPFTPGLTIYGRQGFLQRHPDLEPSRLPGPPRRPVDEVVTMRWQFFADVMEATGEPLCWLDGDIWFWSSPEPLYAELAAAGARFAVSPHRIPPRAAGLPGVTLETHRKYGLYNAGFGWTADAAPLREMAALNREWSYTETVTRPDGVFMFGDQGWLEGIARGHGAHVIAHPGVNLAPWNVHAVTLKAFYPPGGPPLPRPYPVIGDANEPVIAYHFSSLRLNAFDGSVRQYADPAYEVERAPGAVELLYQPYLSEIRKESRT